MDATVAMDSMDAIDAIDTMDATNIAKMANALYVTRTIGPTWSHVMARGRARSRTVARGRAGVSKAADMARHAARRNAHAAVEAATPNTARGPADVWQAQKFELRRRLFPGRRL